MSDSWKSLLIFSNQGGSRCLASSSEVWLMKTSVLVHVRPWIFQALVILDLWHLLVMSDSWKYLFWSMSGLEWLLIFGIFVFSLTQIPYRRHSVIWSSLLFRAPPHSLANSCIHLHPSTLCATATSPVFCLACHWYHSLIAHMCCQKTKKCCPCCGHKKQLPAVLDPSLFPPTITCSHLRLPFDPSPFPLK